MKRILIFALVVFISITFIPKPAHAQSTTQQQAQAVVDDLSKLLLEEFDGAQDAEERAALMYEACYKNPLGNELAQPQKQMYCLIPLRFRLCLTPKLLKLKVQSKSRAAEGPVLFQECEQEKRFDLASTIPNFNEVFNSIYFVDDSSEIAIGEDFNFTGTPPLSNRSFSRLLAEGGVNVVGDAELRFCQSVNGEDSPVCDR